MFKSHGMHSYVLNNNLKSLALLTGFLAVVQLMFAAVWAGFGVILMTNNLEEHYLFRVIGLTRQYSASVLVLSLVWAFLAFLYYKSILRGMTGVIPVSRAAEPRLFNIVENLSIALGITTPRVEISESGKLNAFAMGLTPASASIGVTRGLLLALNDKELEAVIAHELTHIRTLDVRLMTFATIFCGIIFSMGWFLTYRFRELFRQFKNRPVIILPLALYLLMLGKIAPIGFLWQIPLLIGFLILSALVISLGLRFAISRTREFVADLGACELTKNPEALISALTKIHGRDLIPYCDPTVQAMMISAPAEGLFASHPTIQERIDAIVAYAATHLNGLQLLSASARLLPEADDGEIKSGFSIASMKYPAWVSKPLIVLPSLAAGVLTYVMTTSGAVSTFGKMAKIPGLVFDLFNAPLSDATFSSTANLHGTLDTPSDRGNSLMDFVNGMSLGEWKIMLLYLCVGLAMVFSAKFLRSYGFDTPFLRKLSGGPSKEMESDWDDDNAASEDTRINAAIARATQEKAVHNTFAPTQPGFSQRQAFGRAPPR